MQYEKKSSEKKKIKNKKRISGEELPGPQARWRVIPCEQQARVNTGGEVIRPPNRSE